MLFMAICALLFSPKVVAVVWIDVRGMYDFLTVFRILQTSREIELFSCFHKRVLIVTGFTHLCGRRHADAIVMTGHTRYAVGSVLTHRAGGYGA